MGEEDRFWPLKRHGRFCAEREKRTYAPVRDEALNTRETAQRWQNCKPLRPLP